MVDVVIANYMGNMTPVVNPLSENEQSFSALTHYTCAIFVDRPLTPPCDGFIA